MNPFRILADFNGLFGDALCLSHGDTAKDEAGNEIPLAAGMQITVVEEDCDAEGNRDDLIATGIVEPSPSRMACHGSKWVLVIDSNGVRNESDL